MENGHVQNNILASSTVTMVTVVTRIQIHSASSMAAFGNNSLNRLSSNLTAGDQDKLTSRVEDYMYFLFEDSDVVSMFK